ncbi:MAG: hypothetical protein IPF66_16715 [Holophagales bacterium]|nr:hypothetical protein [Holophagales bacterium]
MMLVVAVLLVGTAVGQAAPFGGVLARLAAVNPSLATAVNPGSPFFRNVFEVFFCNLLVGLAIVGQPHILSKALYLADGRQVRRYLGVAIGAGLVFAAVLWVGIAARLTLPELPRIDLVVPAWLAVTFGPGLERRRGHRARLRGLSTLEGIFLALAASSPSTFPRSSPGRSRRGPCVSAVSASRGSLSSASSWRGGSWPTRPAARSPSSPSTALLLLHRLVGPAGRRDVPSPGAPRRGDPFRGGRRGRLRRRRDPEARDALQQPGRPGHLGSPRLVGRPRSVPSLPGAAGGLRFSAVRAVAAEAPQRYDARSIATPSEETCT